MTLHETKGVLIKTGLGSAIGIGGILAIVILFLLGVFIKNILFPPKTEPPTAMFGLLPPLQFPRNISGTSFTYNLQTVTGELPTDVPDRLSVFPILQKPANFLNLNKIKEIVKKLDFTSSDGTIVPENQLADTYYEWDETKNLNRKITFNINTYDFKMTSDYLQSLTALAGKSITQESDAIQTAQGFLGTTGLTPTDIDITKTNTPDNSSRFVTYPQLFSITTSPQGANTLTPARKLTDTQVIRVDLYQNDLKYDLPTGKSGGFSSTIPVTIPVIYPNPPYSTMSFWISSSENGVMVTQAFYTHKDIDLNYAGSTYALKTPAAAYQELLNGKAYIGSSNATGSNIAVQNIFLAYYLGEEPQDYAMPVYVFEGSNGFYAYISALSEDQIKK